MGLLQLAITNFGGGSAHDVRLLWNEPLRDSKGKEISFSEAPIAVLLPKETLRINVDGTIQFYQKYKTADYTGTISFKDSSRRRFSHPFVVNAEKFRGTLLYEDDLAQAYKDVGEIRGALDAIAAELKRIGGILEKPEPSTMAKDGPHE